MFTAGNRIKIKSTHESRTGVMLTEGAMGKIFFVPSLDWGEELIVIMERPVVGSRHPTPRTFVLVDSEQVELVASIE